MFGKVYQFHFNIGFLMIIFFTYILGVTIPYITCLMRGYLTNLLGVHISHELKKNGNGLKSSVSLKCSIKHNFTYLHTQDALSCKYGTNEDAHRLNKVNIPSVHPCIRSMLWKAGF